MFRTRLSLFAVLCPLTLIPDLAWASELAVQSSPMGGLILRSLVFLVLAAAALILAERWSRRFAGRSAIEVVARTRLAAKDSLLLVDAGGRFLLLAVGPGGTNLVAELSEDEAALVRARQPLVPGARPARSER